MKFLLRTFLFFLALTVNALGAAERTVDFQASTWRTEEGLPHSAVNSLVQTRDGYLWIGTFVGLVRFDGVKFVHFSTSKLPQLGLGRVSKLFEDRDGVLWIGMETGRLLAFQDGVARIHLVDSPSFSDAIIAMTQDHAGTIWLQTMSGGFGRLRPSGVEILATNGPQSVRSSRGLVVDQAGSLWVGTRDGLRVWQNDRLVAPPVISALNNKSVDAFTASRDGGIWFFGNRVLRKVRDGKIILEAKAPASFQGTAADLCETSDGGLWLAAANGGLFCLASSGVWQDVSSESGLYGANKVLLEDHEGNLWRGSFGSGLTRLRPKYFSKYELPITDYDRYAGSVSADAAGNVWAVFNVHTVGRVQAGFAGTNAIQFLSQSVVGPGIRIVYVDQRGTVWLGFNDGRVGHWQNDQLVIDLTLRPQSDSVNAFFEDAQTNLWVGFSKGASVGVMPNGDPRQWHLVEGLKYPDVRSIAQTADGAMWFGTYYGGVFRWQNGRWTSFTSRDGLPSDYIRCMHADPDGTLWLGTIEGLCRWRNGKFTAIKAENGLWHDSLSAIVEDGRGNFWLSSFGGVFRVARQQLNEFADGKIAAIQCVGYNHNDGLQTLESPGGFQPAVTKTPDGRLWFPTVDGLTSVDPGQISENKVPPPLALEEILVDGISQPGCKPATVEIPAGRHRIEFRFTALSFTAPEKVRFRHQLEGLDPEWSSADGRRTATYNYVPPGHYTFRLTACNNDGVWNPDSVALAVAVRPFVWQTWWFKLALTLGLMGLLIWAVRARERKRSGRHLERVERQRALERERVRIAHDIHDDVGASLTQIVFLSERVKLASANTAEVDRWNQRVTATARDTIQSLDEIVWAISPKHDTLESLANYLARFAQDHLSLAGIRCVLDVATVLPPMAVSAEVRHNLLLAAREALQNAVAHSGATEVRVGLELGAEMLVVCVAENGRGFDAQRVDADGNGLGNMRHRMDEIGGQIEISGRPGGGTQVKFSLPREKLHVRGMG